MNEFLIERNLVNANAIKARIQRTLDTFSIHDPKIEQWFKRRYADWLQNDYDGVERLTTAEDWSRLMGTQPPDWYLAKIGHEEVLYADLNAAVLGEIEAKLAEYLKSLKGTPLYDNDQRLLRITVPQALEGFEQYLRHLKQQAEQEDRKKAAREGMNDATEHVMDFPDGAFIIEFKSTAKPGAADQTLRQALAAETKMMRNLCVGIFDDTTTLTGGQGEIYAGGIESGTKRIFSIRDAEGQSHVDVEAAVDDDSHGWAIRQVKGPANQTPSPKWTPHVKTLLNRLKLPPNTMGRADIKNLYLAFENGRYGDVEDMAEPMGKPNPDGSVWYRIGTDPCVYHLRLGGQTLATIHASGGEAHNITGPSPSSRPARDHWQTLIMLIRREGLKLRHASEKVGMVYTGESRKRSRKPITEQILLERNLINAGGIKARVNQTLGDLNVTDPKIAQWFKKVYANWLQNDYAGVEQLHTADDWSRLMRSPAPDWYTAKIGQEEMLYADLDNEELRQIESKLAEYFSTLIGTPIHQNEQRMLRITVPQALEAWEQQHRQMQRQNQRALRKSAAQESMNDATHVVMEFGDGAFVVEFKPRQEGGGHDTVLRQALQAETRMMDGICVGMFANTAELTGSHGETYAGGVERGTMRIFSIRDPDGKSHVTIEASQGGGGWHIRQVKGPANQAPSPKWTKHIKTLLNALKVPPDDYGQRDIAKLHLNFSQDGRYGDIEDVSSPISQPYPDGSVWYQTGRDFHRIYHLRLDGQTISTVHTGDRTSVTDIDGPTPNSRPARSTWPAIHDLIRSQKLMVIHEGEKIGMVYVGDVWLDLDDPNQTYQPVEVPLPKGWATTLLDIDGQSRLFVLRKGKVAAGALRAEGNRVVKISLIDDTEAVRQHLLTTVRHLSLQVKKDGDLLGFAYVGGTYMDLYDPNFAGEPVAHPAAGTVMLETDNGSNPLYILRRNREPLCGLMAAMDPAGGSRNILRVFNISQSNGKQAVGDLTPEHRELLNAFLLPRLDKFHITMAQTGNAAVYALGWRQIAGLPIAMPIDHPDLPGEVVARTKSFKILKCRFGTSDVYLARDAGSRTLASMAVTQGVVKQVSGYDDKGTAKDAVSDEVAAQFKKIVKQEAFPVKYDKNVFSWTNMADGSYVDLLDPDLPGTAVAHYGKIEVFEPAQKGSHQRTHYLFRTTPNLQVLVMLEVSHTEIWEIKQPGKSSHEGIDPKLWEPVRNFAIDQKFSFFLTHTQIGLTELEGHVVDPLAVTGEVTDDLGDGWTVRAWDGQTPYRSRSHKAKPPTVWIIQHNGQNAAFLWGTKRHEIKEIVTLGKQKMSAALRGKINAFATLHDFEVTKAGHEHLGYRSLGGHYSDGATYRNANHAVSKGQAVALQNYLLGSYMLETYPMKDKNLKFLRDEHSPEVEAVIQGAVKDMMSKRGMLDPADPLGIHMAFRPEFAAAFLNAVDARQNLLSPENRKTLSAEVRKAVRKAIAQMETSGTVYGQYKDYYGPLFKSGHLDKTVARMLGLFGIAAENLPWEPGENFPDLILTTIRKLDRDDLIETQYQDNGENEGFRLVQPDPIESETLTEISNNLEAYLHGGAITDQQFKQAQQDLLDALNQTMEHCTLACFHTQDDKVAFEEFLTWLGEDPETWMTTHANALEKRGHQSIQAQKEVEIDQWDLSDDGDVIDDRLEEMVDSNINDLEEEAEGIIRERYEAEWRAEREAEREDEDEDYHDDEEFDPREHEEWESTLEELKDDFMKRNREEVEEEIRREEAGHYVQEMVDAAEYEVERQFQVLEK